ncbi:peptidylprolyl isomerase [Pseudomonas vancouverensis]|uniref:peptidylprolyl isomerase n=1 Tax=Pseudomonas vancouverensis TaxID=95300 RepID=A0A1H2MXD9_PSEVA|nr:peptidylprolyl isomerase [Pseudomonas vancouverensis]KAB0495601.1 peptidylprolyl isomerase [Pseudomonas vancouverensis]TDB65404.1 peptidylprolyl isomerase [Pseudomonas vancouverensis]SDU97919.1 peptidyl-prolyl cis-trans isomerase C [Pseudomonas vancouverensis]
MILNVLLVLFALWVPMVWASNGPAAARVNGEEISQLRLERYFAEFLEDQGRAVGSIRNPTAYKQLRKAALDALIDRELLWQEALKRGVVISDAQVQSQVEQTRQAMGGAEVFSRRLQDAGFDEAAYTEYTRRELAARQVFTELTQVDAPDEKKVRAFYAEHRAEMARPEQVQARHILIKVAPGADASTVEAARLRLMKMHAQIVAGADFASVARSGSEDASASVGGELGYFARGHMLPEFEAAAFALSPGAVSEPVRTSAGWHLINLQNHLEAADVTEEQGLDMVRAYLARQQQVQARSQALAQLRANNRIERIDDE